MSALHYAEASVHGRFQPLHLDHMEYLLAAFGVSDYLHVGITQPAVERPLVVPGEDTHRSRRASNPLTYDERRRLVELALEAASIGPSRFRIHPFPIETPESLVTYLPLDVPILTTRIDRWNDTKVTLLREAGYTVQVLYSRAKPSVTGSLIRELIAADDRSWMDLVAPGTQKYLDELGLSERLSALKNDA